MRIFKVGTTRIVADESMRDLPTDAVRQLLQRRYPQVAHATVRERTEADTTIVEFLPKPGRKG